MKGLILAVTALCLLGGAGAQARDVYVDPAAIKDAGSADGSAAHPFADVQMAARSDQITGGDRIILRTGDYGIIKIANARFGTPIEIISEIPGGARADQIVVQGARGIRFHGISVWPRKPGMKLRNLIHARADAADIRFDALDIRGSVTAPQEYMQWSRQDWLETWRVNGVRLDGADTAITNSRITGVAFGVTATGLRANVRGNRIEGFSGDALRGLGDGSVFAHNHVSNCFKVDDNHDDGFQSWATKEDAEGRKTVKDITIENNVIVEWTGRAKHPLRCALQGIGLFDGIYHNFTIRDNLIAVSAWHGIALYAGTDSQIVGNIVVHIAGGTREHPWIMQRNNRNGWKSGKTLVRDNVAMGYKGITGATADNAIARYPIALFHDPGQLKIRLRPDSPRAGADPAKEAAPHDK